MKKGLQASSTQGSDDSFADESAVLDSAVDEQLYTLFMLAYKARRLLTKAASKGRGATFGLRADLVYSVLTCRSDLPRSFACPPAQEGQQLDRARLLPARLAALGKGPPTDVMKIAQVRARLDSRCCWLILPFAAAPRGLG